MQLANDFPRLWIAPTTAARDRKRMLRLLIRDITVVRLHIRWQGGTTETIELNLAPNRAEAVRYHGLEATFMQAFGDRASRCLQLQDLPFLFGRDGTQCLSLEVGQLGLQFEQPLHRIVPALLECAGDQAVGGVDRFIAPFRQVDVVAGPLDPPPPLCSDRLIALFHAGQRFERKLDRQRCDGGHQPLGNGIVERFGGHIHAGLW